jgi:hypothetical protein
MQPVVRHLTWTLAACAVPLLANGCSDLPIDTSPPAVTPAPPSAQRDFAVAVRCTASVAQGRLTCSPPRPRTGPFGPDFLIVGGQNQFVRLTSTNVSYDGSDIFQADVTVDVLFGQPMGTTDGVTNTGVRVFFHSGPTVTGGSGTVTVANADGTDTFTGTDQPYHLYPQILWTNAPSTPKPWQWHVPSTVTTFEFEVYVEGDVVYPNGLVYVAPQPAAIVPGGQVQLSATILDVVTRTLAGSVTWSTGDGTIATVSGTGLVLGVAPGVVDVTASNGGPQADGYSRVTVIGSGFNIALRLQPGASTPPQYVMDAFESAASRWETLITGDLSNVLIQNQAVSCAPALNEVIDDLLIFMDIVPIDGAGGILGQAGPCYYRSTGHLPITGMMQFDVDDLAALHTSGQLEQVILHEMGHVLGIGSYWNAFGLLNPSNCSATSPDPYFSGASAVAAFDAAGGTTYLGNKVPVENTGGAGTVCSHWRESVLDNELMTGWLNAGTNPLSAITVESLADMGYTVNAAGADAYTLPSAPLPAVRAGAIFLNNDILVGPTYMVDEQGRVTVITAPRPPR